MLLWTSRKPSAKTSGRSDLRPSKLVAPRALSVAARPLLLDLDLSADVLELLLDRCGLVLRDALFDRLGGALDEVLGFFEAERGDFADDLDDVDLVAADFG